jgi:ribosome-associated heat shock protein Hsp15
VVEAMKMEHTLRAPKAGRVALLACKVGDRVEAYLHDRERILEVTRLIVKRVGASVAVECFVDHSPPPPEREHDVVVFQRDRGTGRPTKRDKRQLDRLRGRSK